jgi:serine protease inhibitor
MGGRRGIGAAFLAVVLLAGCGESESWSPPKAVSMKLTDSSTGFGLRLTDRLLAEPGAGNVFISPLSATLMLSMAADASYGATRASILTTLGLDPTVDPSAEAKLTIDRLAQSDSNAQLELAQAVWAQQGLALNPAYVGRLRSDYRAQIASLDFTSSGAPKVVNDWVDSATHHKIQQLVDRFDPATVAFLVNATYFHALWATEFTPQQSRGEFHTFSGATARVPTMKRDDGVRRLITPDYQVVVLPYKGGRFSAVILLPRKVLSPAEFSRFLTQATWTDTLTQLHSAVGPVFGGKNCTGTQPAPNVHVDCDGALVMPKFQLDYSAELLPHLVAMGMTANDLSEICRGCFISRVVQKTHLEVDEKGTTAAAATGGAVNVSARLATIVDHPFALALIDNATDAPLFLGVVGQL